MMFDRTRSEEERGTQKARESLEKTRAGLEAERERLERERERLEHLQEKLEARQEALEEREEQIEDLVDEMNDLEELESPEEVREVLDIVGSRIPGIMKDVQSVLYSVESLEKMGEAIGAFYRKLIEAGIPEEQASMLTMNQQHRLNEMTDGRRLHIRPARPPRPIHPSHWATHIKRDGDNTIIRTTSEPIDEPDS